VRSGRQTAIKDRVKFIASFRFVVPIARSILADLVTVSSRVSRRVREGSYGAWWNVKGSTFG